MRQTPTPIVRSSSVLLAVFMLGATLLPIASAQLGGAGGLGSAAQSVGQFAVAPRSAGVQQADGGITSATLSEFTAGASGQGVVKDYTVLGTPVLASLDIAGFQATKSLSGSGTQVLTLEGQKALVSAYDNINGLLVVQNRAAAATQVSAHLAAGAQATAQGAHAAALSTADGLQGSLVIVNTAGGVAKGALDAAALAQGNAKATLQADEALVFRAVPRYDVSAEAQQKIDAVSQAVVSAMAAGELTGEVTSEFKGAQSLFAEASYDKAVKLSSDADVKGRVESVVRAAGGAGGDRQYALAYDLDYPDLPAASEENVAVYVNGVLAERAWSADEATLAGSQAAYYAASVEGRTLVLVNTGASAAAAAQQTITIVSVPDASAAARTLAQLNAALGVTSDVEGEYRDYADGKAAGDVAGKFSSFVVTKADGAMHHYSLVEQGVQVFDHIAFQGESSAEAALDVASTAKYGIKGRLTDIEAHDHVVAKIVATAKAEASGRYELAEGVQAELLSDHLVELTEGTDVVGHLALVEDRRVDAAGSHLSLASAAEVVAELQAGAKVVFRSVANAETDAQARLVAEMLAKGELASEIDLGVVGNAVEATDVDYTGEMHTRVAKSVRGEVAADVRGEWTHTTSLLVSSDRAALLAASPDDIVVTVKDEEAYRARSASEAYATATAQGHAAFTVLAAAHGSHKILVAIPQAMAGGAASVVIKSTLEARNQAAAALDLFGHLRLDSTTGAATGAIVSFVAKTQASAVLDYAVTTQAATTTVFDAVVVGEGTFDILSSVQAPSVKLVNPEATLEIFDTTSALMQVTAATDTTASYSLAAGIEAVQKSDSIVMLNQVSGGHSQSIGAIILMGADGTAATSSVLDASMAGQVHAQLEGGARSIFRAYSGFESELDDAQKNALAEAIAKGHVAGQVIYTTKTAASAGMTLTGHASMQYLSNVDLVTQVASAEEVTLLVDSATNEGRTVIMSLDPGTVSGLVEGQAELLVDGKAVAQAESYYDALDPTDDGGADEYWVHTTEAGNQVLVSLAHFSTRSIALHAPEAPSIFMFTTLGLALVVVAQAVLPRVRRTW